MSICIHGSTKVFVETAQVRILSHCPQSWRLVRSSPPWPLTRLGHTLTSCHSMHRSFNSQEPKVYIFSLSAQHYPNSFSGVPRTTGWILACLPAFLPSTRQTLCPRRRARRTRTPFSLAFARRIKHDACPGCSSTPPSSLSARG